MNNFFKLIEQYRTQDEPAFCGLASLSMVLNSLSIDPRRIWKGPWRWFHEEMLDCCRPLSAVRTQGVSLDHAACLARCNGATVELVRPLPVAGGASLEAFREAVLEVCSTPPGAPQSHMILCYSRRALSQSGSGHFSPLGGYSRARDMVLVLDSARFKYPPHWVPLPLMYAALAELNRATGMPRGYLRLGSQPLLQSLLFALDVRDAPQATVARRFIRHDLARIVARCAAEEGGGAAAQGGEASREALRDASRDGAPRDDASQNAPRDVPAPNGTAPSMAPAQPSLLVRALRRAALAAPHEALASFLAVRAPTPAPRFQTASAVLEAARRAEGEGEGGECCDGEEGPCTHRDAVATLVREIQSLPATHAVAAALRGEGQGGTPGSPAPPTPAADALNAAAAAAAPSPLSPGALKVVRVVLALLLAPRDAWDPVRRPAQDAPEALERARQEVAVLLGRGGGGVLDHELEYLEHQLRQIPDLERVGGVAGQGLG